MNYNRLGTGWGGGRRNTLSHGDSDNVGDNIPDNSSLSNRRSSDQGAKGQSEKS